MLSTSLWRSSCRCTSTASCGFAGRGNSGQSSPVASVSASPRLGLPTAGRFTRSECGHILIHVSLDSMDMSGCTWGISCWTRDIDDVRGPGTCDRSYRGRSGCSVKRGSIWTGLLGLWKRLWTVYQDGDPGTGNGASTAHRTGRRGSAGGVTTDKQDLVSRSYCVLLWKMDVIGAAKRG